MVELTPKFAEIIRSQARAEGLDVRVIVRNVFETTDDLRQDYQLILLSEVVPDFRSTQQLRRLFELAAACLAPGGQLVFNTFLPRYGYEIDDAAREFGQQAYTGMFSRQELSTASEGLPLELVADDSVYEYEQANLPTGAWPPTSWYADWVSGLDVFPSNGTRAQSRCAGWYSARPTDSAPLAEQTGNATPAAARRSPRPTVWPTGTRAS